MRSIADNLRKSPTASLTALPQPGQSNDVIPEKACVEQLPIDLKTRITAHLRLADALALSRTSQTMQAGIVPVLIDRNTKDNAKGDLELDEMRAIRNMVAQKEQIALSYNYHERLDFLTSDASLSKKKEVVLAIFTTFWAVLDAHFPRDCDAWAMREAYYFTLFKSYLRKSEHCSEHARQSLDPTIFAQLLVKPVAGEYPSIHVHECIELCKRFAQEAPETAARLLAALMHNIRHEKFDKKSDALRQIGPKIKTANEPLKGILTRSALACCIDVRDSVKRIDAFVSLSEEIESRSTLQLPDGLAPSLADALSRYIDEMRVVKFRVSPKHYLKQILEQAENFSLQWQEQLRLALIARLDPATTIGAQLLALLEQPWSKKN